MLDKDLLIDITKRIWENNDLDAVCFLQNITNSDAFFKFYKEHKEAAFDNSLYYNNDHKGRGYIYYYTLEPIDNESERYRYIYAPLIDNTDYFGFVVPGYEQMVKVNRYSFPHVDIHMLSGLVLKIIGEITILFPKVVTEQHRTTVKPGDAVEYITLVDQRSHCGRVLEVEGDSVFLEEYEGYAFSNKDCDLLFQDDGFGQKHYIECVPKDACRVIDSHDYRAKSICFASTLRKLWVGPEKKTCDTFREWFHEGEDIFHAFCSKVQYMNKLFFFPAINVTEWKEVPPNGATHTTNFSNQQLQVLSFDLGGLYEFDGDPFYKHYIDYSPTTGMIHKHFSDDVEDVDTFYPDVINKHNTCVPQVGSVVLYQDCSESEPSIAKVVKINGDMVAAILWVGTNYYRRTLAIYGDTYVCSTKIVIPISACEIMPDIVLSEMEIRSLLRLESSFDYPLYARFVAPKKYCWTVEDIEKGLKRISKTLLIDPDKYHYELTIEDIENDLSEMPKGLLDNAVKASFRDQKLFQAYIQKFDFAAYELMWRQFLSNDYLSHKASILDGLQLTYYYSWDDPDNMTQKCDEVASTRIHDAIRFFDAAAKATTGFVFGADDFIILHISNANSKTIRQDNRHDYLVPSMTAQEVWNEQYANEHEVCFDNLHFVGMFYSTWESISTSVLNGTCMPDLPKLIPHLSYRGVLSVAIMEQLSNACSIFDIDQKDPSTNCLLTLIDNYLA